MRKIRQAQGGQDGTDLVDECCDDLELGELGCELLDTLRTGNQVQEKDTVLGDAPGLEHFDSHGGRSAYTC